MRRLDGQALPSKDRTWSSWLRMMRGHGRPSLARSAAGAEGRRTLAASGFGSSAAGTEWFRDGIFLAVTLGVASRISAWGFCRRGSAPSRGANSPIMGPAGVGLCGRNLPRGLEWCSERWLANMAWRLRGGSRSSGVRRSGSADGSVVDPEEIPAAVCLLLNVKHTGNSGTL